jgi:hypothetical protein
MVYPYLVETGSVNDYYNLENKSALSNYHKRKPLPESFFYRRKGWYPIRIESKPPRKHKPKHMCSGVDLPLLRTSFRGPIISIRKSEQVTYTPRSNYVEIPTLIFPRAEELSR